jgi:hypothetical protein
MLQGPELLRTPALPLALIHRSAWKWNSANFACTEFYEVREMPRPNGRVGGVVRMNFLSFPGLQLQTATHIDYGNRDSFCVSYGARRNGGKYRE